MSENAIISERIENMMAVYIKVLDDY